jgi:hypothetical protein
MTGKYLLGACGHDNCNEMATACLSSPLCISFSARLTANSKSPAQCLCLQLTCALAAAVLLPVLVPLPMLLLLLLLQVHTSRGGLGGGCDHKQEGRGEQQQQQLVVPSKLILICMRSFCSATYSAQQRPMMCL